MMITHKELEGGVSAIIYIYLCVWSGRERESKQIKEERKREEKKRKEEPTIKLTVKYLETP